MALDPDKFADDLDEFIERFLADALKRIGESQPGIIDNITEAVNALERLKDGSIKTNAKNLKTLTLIRGELDEAVITAEYKKAVELYIAEVDKLQVELSAYLEGVLPPGFDPNSANMQAVFIQAREMLRETLLNTGVKDQIVNKIYSVVSRNVIGGMPYREMVTSIRDFLTENDGRLVRWSKQILADGTYGFARNYIQASAQGLDVEYWRYSGGLIRDSRPFCEARNGHYYTTEAVKSWASLSWDGKNPETTSDNIFQLLGGYNCRHTLLPAQLSDVPKDERVS